MKPTEFPDLTGPVQLLDVRLSDDYEAAHLAGAANNCVFEVAFAERLSKTAPDPAALTVVYGAHGGSREAEMAAEKLRRAGFRDVRILEGGIEAASAAGLAVESGDPVPPEPPPLDGAHPIDLAESRFEWLGRNLLNKHWGSAKFSGGQLTFDQGTLAGGDFTIDLRTLDCADLDGSPLHDVLVAHLHSDDFFDVENHPEASFTIRGATPVAGAAPGSPNVSIRGDLTIRGQTHPVEFAAATGRTESGHAAAQAAFSIDRTRWGILYGSGKFFHRLAGHLVNDLIEIQVRIVTR
ncbi:MAG: YceI family protein [Verrucomicrobiales bacterium]